MFKSKQKSGSRMDWLRSCLGGCRFRSCSNKVAPVEEDEEYQVTHVMRGFKEVEEIKDRILATRRQVDEVEEEYLACQEQIRKHRRERRLFQIPLYCNRREAGVYIPPHHRRSWQKVDYLINKVDDLKKQLGYIAEKRAEIIHCLLRLEEQLRIRHSNALLAESVFGVDQTKPSSTTHPSWTSSSPSPSEAGSVCSESASLPTSPRPSPKATPVRESPMHGSPAPPPLPRTFEPAEDFHHATLGVETPESWRYLEQRPGRTYRTKLTALCKKHEPISELDEIGEQERIRWLIFKEDVRLHIPEWRRRRRHAMEYPSLPTLVENNPMDAYSYSGFMPGAYSDPVVNNHFLNHILLMDASDQPCWMPDTEAIDEYLGLCNSPDEDLAQATEPNIIAEPQEASITEELMEPHIIQVPTADRDVEDSCSSDDDEQGKTKPPCGAEGGEGVEV